MSGCVSDETPSQPTDDETTTSSVDDETPETTTADGAASVAELTVADYIRYALAGTHPHVHRRVNRQYVVVRVETSMSMDALRDRLTLELDGESASLAARQPFSWQHETADLAFAVPKDESVDAGRVLLDGSEVLALSSATLERLNAPPMFEVAEPTVSPKEISTGEESDATVEFTLSNVGDGPGEFGASLEGNYLSGSNILTATLDAGAERVVTGTTPIIGDGTEATIRLDWGSDEWTTAIPVVGEKTESGTD
ncbi:MAG: hypothetical protein ACOCSP_02690 [archaeon]